MKYEGKIYGKVAGKYIELQLPKDLIEFRDTLLGELKKRFESAKQQSKDFDTAGLRISADTSAAMAEAYRQVINFVENSSKS